MLRLKKGNSGIVALTSNVFTKNQYISMSLILKRYKFLYKEVWCFLNFQGEVIVVRRFFIIVEFLDLQYKNSLCFLKEIASKLTFKIGLVYVK